MSFRVFRPPYTDKATGERRESPTYHVAFRDHLNRRQSVAGSTKERETTALAVRLEQLVRHRRTGEQLPPDLSRWLDTLPPSVRGRLTRMDLIDARMVSADTPLADHLRGRADEAGNLIEPGYEQALRARGDTDHHVRVTVGRIRRVFDAGPFIFWRDLSKPAAVTRIEVFLGALREKGEITGQSLNYYIRCVKAFCRWMSKTDRALGVALESLEKVSNAAADAKPRRELSVEEIRLLIDAAATGAVRSGLDGTERAMLYRFAFETGMRPNQIRNLTVGDFDLTADPPTVTAAAKFVKRRTRHVQVLRPATAAELSDLFASKLPDAPAFKMPSAYQLARMLRRDLAAARVKWIGAAPTPKVLIERKKSDFLEAVNHGGDRADFYSIRHGHGTALADAGVPQKDISASMHHTSERTTARYLHSGRKAVAAAVGAIPDVAYSLKQVATGTDGEIDPCLRTACATGRIPMESGGVRGGLAVPAEAESSPVFLAFVWPGIK